jgi:hypothetical protein
MKQFPIPSAPAPSGGEDKPRADVNFAKGGDVRAAHYAKGGAVLGRTRDFMKEPDPFTGGRADFKKRKPQPGDPQEYEKSGKGAKGRDKSLSTVMPRQ